MYADDVVIMARSKRAMEELLKALNKNANEVGLSINQENAKYLEVNTKRSNINRSKNVNIRQHNFERVQTCNFLGSVINDKNVNHAKILMRIKREIKPSLWIKNCFHQSFMGKNKNIYISTIRPLVTYAAETWIDGEGYDLFNDLWKKNPEKSIGPIQERDRWRIRTNHELNKSIGGAH